MRRRGISGSEAFTASFLLHDWTRLLPLLRSGRGCRACGPSELRLTNLHLLAVRKACKPDLVVARGLRGLDFTYGRGIAEATEVPLPGLRPGVPLNRSPIAPEIALSPEEIHHILGAAIQTFVHYRN